MLLHLALLFGALTQRIICPIVEVNTIHVLASWGLLDAVLLFLLVRTNSSTTAVISSFAGINFVYFSSLIVTTVIYRLYFHPLRHLPGHKIAAASKLHEAYLNASGQFSFNTRALHKLYGPVIRTGPNHVSITSLSALRLLIPTPNHRQRGPTNEIGKLFGDGSGNVATTRDNNQHKLWRPTWEKAFTRGRVTEYAPRVEKHVEQFVCVLRGTKGAEVDANARVGDFTFDVMSDLGFGVDEGLQFGGGNREYNDFFKSFLRTAAIMGSLRNLVDILQFAPHDKYMRKFVALTENMIAKRLEIGSRRNDVFTNVLKGPFSRAQMAANAMLLIAAGSDTTSSVLTNTLRELAMHPEWQEKVLKEVREHDGAVNVQATNSMPVVCAVVDESLRLWNPIPAGVESIVPPGGITIDGVFLPPYTVARAHHLTVMTGISSLPSHHHRHCANLSIESHRPQILPPRRGLASQPLARRQGDARPRAQSVHPILVWCAFVRRKADGPERAAPRRRPRGVGVRDRDRRWI